MEEPRSHREAITRCRRMGAINPSVRMEDIAATGTTRAEARILYHEGNRVSENQGQPFVQLRTFIWAGNIDCVLEWTVSGIPVPPDKKSIIAQPTVQEHGSVAWQFFPGSLAQAVRLAIAAYDELMNGHRIHFDFSLDYVTLEISAP